MSGFQWFWQNPVLMDSLQMLAILLPPLLATWWFFTRFAFRSIKSYVSTRKRLEKIYSHPVAAAIHSSTIIASIAALVIAAYK
jgi:hypothetical protein